jgi:predicted negative regulator of RcsB-dependent stress response
MDDNLTDQQQAEVVKQWLKDNGLSILFSIGLGISAYFGLQFYQQSQLKESESASRLYAEVEFALKQQRMSQAQNLLQEMDNSFSGSPYQQQSHLAMAKLHMDSLDYDNAIIQLEFVMENAIDESFEHIARLRIARIMVEQDELDGALTLLNSVSASPIAYAPYYEGIKGDIYSAQGQLEKAKVAYSLALDSLEPGNFDFDFIKMKSDQIQTDAVPLDSNQS